MSDHKQTPITREWLASKGFHLYKTQFAVTYIRAINDDRAIEYDPDGDGRVHFLHTILGAKNSLPLSCMDTQERLSALWFALTGEEL